MIEVQHLTKYFSGHTALRDLSFSVPRGQVVGFLGPNGAGKTTTMRILSTFLPPSSGRAHVAGFDVARSPLEVRRRIGFMPENNPLHLDMRVTEYLRYRAGLKGLRGLALRGRLGAVVEACELKEVERTMIGHLSKGYRQRIGVADAILSQPDLIMLDEPTIGLDPHQVRAFRQVIQSLAIDHTVLLSTHILSEVELLCDRILVLHRGRLLADDSKEAIHRRVGASSRVILEVAAPWEALTQCLEQMPSVGHFEMEAMDDGFLRCRLTPKEDLDLRQIVYETFRNRPWVLRELTSHRPTLEELFVKLTDQQPRG